MHLIKPSWLSHSGPGEQKDFEVYSCHVSPDGSRLATAGGDGHIRVWSTEAIFSPNSKDHTSTKPRQLCHMSHHLGTVHSVRFSPNGRYLASGADDKLICVYHLDPNPPSHASTFGTSEPPPVENWKTFKRLVGHENDVQDLAWSCDGSLLVSVGLDSKVVVWSGHTFEKLKTLAVHQSHVKGITFDPANKFFATASDDRTIKIFRFTPPAPNATQHDMVSNFELETTISSPFKSSPLTTYFRRCSWSPDGNHIAAANAVNGPVSSVAIIERARWESEINLIGHEGPTEVCSFSPRLFYTQKPSDKDESATNLVTVIASAGQDKTLSIWNTNTSRPLVILQDVASKSISDLSWTPDGQTLFAASLDGSIVAVRFEVGELGWVANAEENDKALQKYGSARKGMGLAEDVEGLHLENHSKEGELRGAESRMGALMGDFQPARKDDKAQKESEKGKEDEKEPSTNGAAATAAAAATTTTTTTTTTTATTTAVATVTNGLVNGGKDEDKKKSTEEENADNTAKRIAELKSRVTYTKEGKKRVAPLLVSSSGTGLSSLPQTQLVGASSAKQPPNDTPQTVLDLSKPYDGLPRGGIATIILGNKRKVIGMDGDDEDEPAGKRSANSLIPVLTHGLEGLEPATATTLQGMLPTPEWIRPCVLNPAISYGQIRLAVPKIRTHILRPLERGVLLGESTQEEASKIPENIIFEARNPTVPREPSHITVTKRGVLLWQDYLPRAVLLVTSNKDFWAAACEDGSIHTWTPAGRRLMNAIVMDAQPVILESRGRWLLAISAVGQAHVWDVKTHMAPHPPVSLAPVLDLAMTPLAMHGPTVAPAITSAHLNSIGCIVVTLNSGDGFFYSNTMYAWQRLSEPWWAIGSQYWNSNDSSVSALQTTAVGPVGSSSLSSARKSSKKGRAPRGERGDRQTGGGGSSSYSRSRSHSHNNDAEPGADADADVDVNVSAGVIPFLERHTTTEFLLKGRAYTLQRLIKSLAARGDDAGSGSGAGGFAGLESAVSVAHLENRLAGALALGARDEFRLYLFMYAKRIGAEGLRGKVEELLKDLLGGILRDKAGSEDGEATAVARRKQQQQVVAFGEPETGKGGPAPALGGRGWDTGADVLCGWDRRELLKGVVMILGKFRDLQRLTVQYARILDMAGDDVDDDEDDEDNEEAEDEGPDVEEGNKDGDQAMDVEP